MLKTMKATEADQNMNTWPSAQHTGMFLPEDLISLLYTNNNKFTHDPLWPQIANSLKKMKAESHNKNIRPRAQHTGMLPEDDTVQPGHVEVGQKRPCGSRGESASKASRHIGMNEDCVAAATLMMQLNVQRP